MVDAGALYRAVYSVVSETGALINATTVTLSIFLPDGTPVTPVAMVNDSTGKYHYDFLTTVAGRHTGTIVSTIPTTARGFSFEVTPILASTIVSLTDQKNYLGMSLTRTTSDTELLDFMRVATVIIENKVGSVVTRTITDEFQPTGDSLWLKNLPVIGNPTLITPWLTTGIGYNVAAVRTDSESGRVTNMSGLPFLGGPFAVTYKSGRTVVPANLSLAAKQAVKYMWETQRGGMVMVGVRSGEAQEMFNIAGREYVVPRRVMSAIQPHKQTPRVA
jgi:hypothetical protein